MGYLRIIAGELKGRRVRVPAGSDVRPTGDRVREALFSVLGEAVSGARVLDAYCGSGALGLEALSRGARQVVFVDSRLDVCRALEDNVRTLALGARSRVVCQPVLSYLRDGRQNMDPGPPFDLVLADPPYATPDLRPLLTLAAALLAAGGTLALERESARGEALDGPDGLEGVRSYRYGRTTVDLYRRKGPLGRPVEIVG